MPKIKITAQSSNPGINGFVGPKQMVFMTTLAAKSNFSIPLKLSHEATRDPEKKDIRCLSYILYPPYKT